MSREKKRRKKKHDKDKNDENDNHRSKDRLFTEADARAADLPYDMMNYPVSQPYPPIEERRIPLGVVEIDKSVKFPSPTQKSPRALKSGEDQSREHVHLPSITHHTPYEYYDPSNPAHHYGYFSHPYPTYEQYRMPHHHHHHDHGHDHDHHHHHHRHHHRRHRHHHRHEQEVETYDRRWWYMPVGSVHRPQSKKVVEYQYQYVTPKWYHSPTAQSGLTLISQEAKTRPTRKYADCRCEVCRPSKETPRGVRWTVSE